MSAWPVNMNWSDASSDKNTRWLSHVISEKTRAATSVNFWHLWCHRSRGFLALWLAAVGWRLITCLVRIEKKYFDCRLKRSIKYWKLHRICQAQDPSEIWDFFLHFPPLVHKLADIQSPLHLFPLFLPNVFILMKHSLSIYNIIHTSYIDTDK